MAIYKKEKNKKMDERYISQEFAEIFRDPATDRVRFIMEMTWMRNILYYLGEQWLSWFEQTHSFGRRYDLQRAVPTPVSNIIRDYVRSMKALTLNKKFTIRVWPESNENEDKDAAQLAENLLRYMDSLNDFSIDDVKETVELWRILTGNGFARSFADVDNGLYVMTKGGGFSKGEVGTEPIIPFSMVVPHLGDRLEKKSYVGVKTLKPVEWVQDTYKILIEEGEMDKNLISYEKQLLNLVANVSPWKGRGFEQDIEEDLVEKMVLFKEIEYRPTTDYPQGRYVAMAGETIVTKREQLPIPVEKDGTWFYTFTHFPYNYTPGSFWSTSGIDDLISPQNTINEVDQALAINRKSLGRPWVLSPSELILKRRSHKGQALLEMRYDARTAAGTRPQVMPGTPYPQQIIEERNNQREVAQEASGDPKNILRGQSPHSGASGVMIDILREAAELSHSPDINRFYRAWQRVQRKRLVIAKNLYSEERIIKVIGKGKNIYIKAFRGSDLRNNTDVRLEPDNALATTNAGRNELMIRLIQGNFFGDIQMRPELQRDLVRRLGLGSLPEENDVHIQKAEYENSILAYANLGSIDKPGKGIQYIAFPEGRIPDPDVEPVEGEEPVWMTDAEGNDIRTFPQTRDETFRIDNNAVHLQIIEELILSAEFKEFDQDRQRYILGHRDIHEAAYQAEMQEAQTQAAIQAALTGEVEEGMAGAVGGQEGRATVAPPAGAGV